MKRAGSIATGCACLRTTAAALVVSFCAAAPSFAQTLPNLSEVTGLAAGDVLNVRADKSARSADLGDLAVGTKVEVIAVDQTGNWARILWEDGNAWVSTKYLQEVPRPQLDSGMPAALTCSGSEPYWTLDIASTGDLTMTLPDGTINDDIAWSTQSRNEGESRYAFGNATKTAVLSRTICTAGGTGQDTGWTLDLTLTGDAPSLLSGCCTAN